MAGFRSPSKIARRLKLMPLAVRYVRDWPRFMLNYALGLTPERPYRFRNGATLSLGRGVDHAPIVEIFLHGDYGEGAPDGVIVDIGANIGVYTVFACAAAPGARVFAYEPLPGYFDLLRRNVEANAAASRVRCFNLAVAGHTGSQRLYVEGEGLFFPTVVDDGKRAGSTSMEAPCTTLARILDGEDLERIDLLKMDCEGAEYDILYRTPEIYFTRVKEIRMEHHRLDDEDANADGLAQFLRRHGYEIVLMKMNSPSNGVLWARRHD